MCVWEESQKCFHFNRNKRDNLNLYLFSSFLAIMEARDEGVSECGGHLWENFVWWKQQQMLILYCMSSQNLKRVEWLVPSPQQCTCTATQTSSLLVRLSALILDALPYLPLDHRAPCKFWLFPKIKANLLQRRPAKLKGKMKFIFSLAKPAKYQLKIVSTSSKITVKSHCFTGNK